MSDIKMFMSTIPMLKKQDAEFDFVLREQYEPCKYIPQCVWGWIDRFAKFHAEYNYYECDLNHVKHTLMFCFDSCISSEYWKPEWINHEIIEQLGIHCLETLQSNKEDRKEFGDETPMRMGEFREKFVYALRDKQTSKIMSMKWIPEITVPDMPL